MPRSKRHLTDEEIEDIKQRKSQGESWNKIDKRYSEFSLKTLIKKYKQKAGALPERPQRQNKYRPYSEHGKTMRRRIDWVVKMFNKYIDSEGSLDAYVRGLHYFIVSLPENMRSDFPFGLQTKNECKLYENTKNDSKLLGRALVQARIAGLIPYSSIKDHKNDEIDQTIYTRKTPYISDKRLWVSTDGFINISSDRRDKNYEKLFDNLDVTIGLPEFYSQTHRLVIAIEKAKAKTGLKRLAYKYGADFLSLEGNISWTRVYEICQLAKDENKPLMIFYITDLDFAGWNMVEIIKEIINVIYPREENDCKRIMLNRSQAEELNLPKSFDVEKKDIGKGAINRFIRETGSSDCIEIDAVPGPILLEKTEEILQKHAKLEDDRQIQKETQEKADDFIETLEIPDHFEKPYNNLKNEFNEFLEHFKVIFQPYKDQILKFRMGEDKLIEEIGIYIQEEFEKAKILS